MTKLFKISFLTWILLCGCQAHQDPRILKSPNFNGESFQNTSDLQAKSLWDALKMWLTSDWSDWPEWIEVPEGPQPLDRVAEQEARVTFINHATVLIQSHGLNILTDPQYSQRSSPFSFIGPERIHQPGVSFANLPKIDLVLISHDHYDHLDTETLDRLILRDAPLFIVGLGVGERLKDGARIVELDWWQSHQVSEKLEVSFAEVQHFSGRGLTDRDSTLWGAFVLEFPTKKIYFGGDSGYADHYKKTFDRYGAMDLAFIPIGAYEPRDFMKPMHMNPAEAVQAHIELNSKRSFGIHYGTFQLTAEPYDEPPQELERQASKQGLDGGEFGTLVLGVPTVIP